MLATLPLLVVSVFACQNTPDPQPAPGSSASFLEAEPLVAAGSPTPTEGMEAPVFRAVPRPRVKPELVTVRSSTGPSLRELLDPARDPVDLADSDQETSDQDPGPEKSDRSEPFVRPAASQSPWVRTAPVSAEGEDDEPEFSRPLTFWEFLKQAKEKREREAARKASREHFAASRTLHPFDDSNGGGAGGVGGIPSPSFAPPKIKPRTVERRDRTLVLSLAPFSDGIPREEWDTVFAVHPQDPQARSFVDLSYAKRTTRKYFSTDDADTLNKGKPITIVFRENETGEIRQGGVVDVSVTVLMQPPGTKQILPNTMPGPLTVE